MAYRRVRKDCRCLCNTTLYSLKLVYNACPLHLTVASKEKVLHLPVVLQRTMLYLARAVRRRRGSFLSVSRKLLMRQEPANLPWLTWASHVSWMDRLQRWAYVRENENSGYNTQARDTSGKQMPPQQVPPSVPL